MAIELSPGLITTMSSKVVGTGSRGAWASTNPSPWLYTLITDGGTSTYNNMGGLWLISGTVPADANAVTTYSSFSSRILWYVPSYSLNLTSVYSGATATLNSGQVLASASGTATWFFGGTRYYASGTISDTIFQGFMGTVGVTGSGADLTLASTTITSGLPYILSGLQITIPTSW